CYLLVATENLHNALLPPGYCAESNSGELILDLFHLLNLQIVLTCPNKIYCIWSNRIYLNHPRLYPVRYGQKVVRKKAAILPHPPGECVGGRLSSGRTINHNY